MATWERRSLVSVMAAAGASEEMIAEELAIDEKTLRKYYRHELDTGFERVMSRIKTAVVNRALKAANANASRQDLACAFFVLARRGGPEWRVTDNMMLGPMPSENRAPVLTIVGVAPTHGDSTD